MSCCKSTGLSEIFLFESNSFFHNVLLVSQLTQLSATDNGKISIQKNSVNNCPFAFNGNNAIAQTWERGKNKHDLSQL